LSPHAVLAGDRKGCSSVINRFSAKGRRFGGPDQKVLRAVFGAQTTFFAPYIRPDRAERASGASEGGAQAPRKGTSVLQMVRAGGSQCARAKKRNPRSGKLPKSTFAV